MFAVATSSVDRVGEVIASCSERNVEFKGAEPVNVTGGVPSLIVFQDEWATISTASGIHYIGSTEATTCILLFLENARKNLVSAAHYSSADDCALTVAAQLNSLVGTVGEKEEAIVRVSMVGGFLVDSSCEKGRGLARELIKCLRKEEARWPGRLRVAFDLCFIMGINSQPHPQSPGEFNLPVYRNAVYSVVDRAVRPCLSWNMSSPIVPEATFRYVSLFCRDDNILPCIFDAQSETVVLKLRRLPIWSGEFLAAMANNLVSDDFILKNFSTSPLAESDNFPNDIRAACKFLLEHGSDCKQYYKGRAELRFKLAPSSSAWELVDV